jgi:DNA polymerase-3 subunit delta
MTVITRDQLNTLVRKTAEENPSQVYLIFGERFLCQQAAEKITGALLSAGGGNLHVIDGSQDDFSQVLGRIASYSLFPGRQVYRINDTRLFHSQKITHSLWKKAVTAHKENNLPLATGYLCGMLEAAGLDAGDPENDPAMLSATAWKKTFGFARPSNNLAWTAELLKTAAGDMVTAETPAAGDQAQALEDTLTLGIPARNALVLVTEDVDKRKRLYKLLADKYTVVNLSVESGSSTRAQKDQRSVLLGVLKNTLTRFDKTMRPNVADLLFERVGFHPVAVAMETEKLALFTGSRKEIERADLDALVGRTRQEALFELTEALGKRDMERSLTVAQRLQDNGIHPLAIIATVRNYLRTLLLFRALQELPEADYSPSMSPARFQHQCLPLLKNNQQWKKELSGHPYAMYMQFKAASGFHLSTLKSCLELALQADFRLKGSPVASDTIISHLIINMLTL